MKLSWDTISKNLNFVFIRWAFQNLEDAYVTLEHTIKVPLNEKLEVEIKKPYEIDRNKKGSTLSLSKKEQPNTKGMKPRKFKLIKYIRLLGQ